MSLTTALGYTPVYQIKKGGSDITGQFNDRALVIQIESVEGGGNGDKLTIILDDRDFTIASPVTDGDGKATLDVFLGYKETAMYEQGNFEIFQTVYSGPPETMQLLGVSQGFTSNSKAPLITSFDGKTVGDIVTAIATASGTSASVDPDLGNQKIKFLNQNSSAMHLLQEMERRYGGVAKFENGYLSFTKRGSGQTASNAVITPFTLTPEDFGTWSVTESSRHTYSKVRASYWDGVQHKLVWLTNTNPAAGNSSVPDLVSRAFNTRDEAQAYANARMDASNRTASKGTLTLAKGDPSIRGSTPFTITGMREGIDGDWIASKVTHSFAKESGITTTIEFYSPGAAGSGEPSTTESENGDASPAAEPSVGPGGIGHA